MSVSALEVSRKFVGHDEIFDRNHGSELVMHFGQFLDHDLALTPHLEGKKVENVLSYYHPIKESDLVKATQSFIVSQSQPESNIE